MYYFAYGSNMNMKQMRRRCPTSRFICRVFLPNYKFVYDGISSKRRGAVANIVELTGGIVWGGLFEIDEECLANLDCCEDFPNSYDRKELHVRDDTGIEYCAITYFRVGEPLGKPSEEYCQTILQGARECGLPQEYIKTYL